MDKDKDLKSAMGIIWDSIDSHLAWYGEKTNKLERGAAGDDKHHKKCIQEYIEVLRVLAKYL